MSDESGAAPEFDAARLASELALQAFYASEHERPLFIIVNYDNEADKVSFLERLRKKLIEKGLSTRPLVFEDKNQDQFIKIYDLIAEATREKSISIIIDLPRQRSGISPDFLFYINLHRDRIARQNLRFILFLHSSDSEKFINSAGDLWDFRDRTYWLERAAYTETRSFWQHLYEKNAALEKPETDEKEISEHIALVKRIAEQTENPEERASLMLDLAGWLERRHSYDLSIESAIEGIRFLSGKKNRIMASLKNKAGHVFYLKGSFEKALKCHEESLELFRWLGDRRGEGAAQNNISQVYQNLGNYEKALKAIKESVVISKELGDHSGEGIAINNIAVIYNDLGRYEDALKFFEESLVILRRRGDLRSEGWVLNNIAGVYCALGKHESALRILEESLIIAREAGDFRSEGNVLNNISQIYDAIGKLEEALTALDKSLEIRKKLGDKQGEGVTLNNIAGIYRAWGRYDEALKLLEQSLAITREIGDRKGEEIACQNIGLEYERRRDLCKAIDYVRRSVEIKLELGSPDYQSSLDYLKKLEEKASKQASIN